VASFHVEIKSGHKGVAAIHSTYIAREGWHHRRADLMFSGHGNLPPWAEGVPAKFWKAADKHERANGATYRELVIALARELNLEQLRVVVARLIAELVGNRPYQFAVHASKSSLQGEYNPHLHLMYSDRLPDGIERSAEQLFSRYNPANPTIGGRRKGSSGMTRLQVREDLIGKRKTVADIQNEYLIAHGHEGRLDHRSLKDQGRTRLAERHLGPARINSMSAEEKAKYAALREKAKAEKA
jgi:hypothetical protein